MEREREREKKKGKKRREREKKKINDNMLLRTNYRIHYDETIVI